MSTSPAKRGRGAAGSRSPCCSPRRLPSSSRLRSGVRSARRHRYRYWWRTSTRPRGRPRHFTAGAAVMSGSTVTTSAGTLAMTLTSGVHLRLDASSTVRVDSATDVALERGAVYVDSAGAHPTQPGASPISIHTPAGLVRDIGTQFEVRLAGAGIRIRVRDGQVRVTYANGVDARADAGEELFSRPDGSDRSTSPPHCRNRERVGVGRTRGTPILRGGKDPGRVSGLGEPRGRLDGDVRRPQILGGRARNRAPRPAGSAEGIDAGRSARRRLADLRAPSPHRWPPSGDRAGDQRGSDPMTRRRPAVALAKADGSVA